MTSKCAFLILSLIDLTYGAETINFLDAEDTTIELAKTSYSSTSLQSHQSFDVSVDSSASFGGTPIKIIPDVSSVISDASLRNTELVPQTHIPQKQRTFKDLAKTYKTPYLQAVISLGIIGAFAVGGYFLVEYVYKNLYPQYSPPEFSPVSGGWGSSCNLMNIPQPCNCYCRAVPYSPPLDFSAIPNYLSGIQKSCSLSNETLLKIGDHLVSAWTEINGGGGANNYMSAQCQNESFVKDFAWVGHFPAKHGINSRSAHTDLIISVGSYTAACLAHNDPLFGGTIAGWIIACILSLIIQWSIYGCCVS